MLNYVSAITGIPCPFLFEDDCFYLLYKEKKSPHMRINLPKTALKYVSFLTFYELLND